MLTSSHVQVEDSFIEFSLCSLVINRMTSFICYRFVTVNDSCEWLPKSKIIFLFQKKWSRCSRVQSTPLIIEQRFYFETWTNIYDIISSSPGFEQSYHIVAVCQQVNSLQFYVYLSDRAMTRTTFRQTIIIDRLRYAPFKKL